MSNAIEKRFIEFRRSGNELEGVVVRYGEQAYIPGIGAETFNPGALKPVADGVILNLMHNREKPVSREGAGLTITASAESVSLRSALPDTIYGREAKELVDAGVLRGFSVEFRSLKETRAGDTRVIQEAELHAVGLVDKPAYKGSVLQHRFKQEYRQGSFNPIHIEYRQRNRRPVITGEILYDVEGMTSAANKRSQKILKGAFKNLEEGEIFLLNGFDYGKPLASTQDGNLIIRNTDKSLTFEARDLPRTTATADLLTNARKFKQDFGVVPGYVEKQIDQLSSELFDGFAQTVVEEADLCEINVVTRSNGNSILKFATNRKSDQTLRNRTRRGR